LLSAARQHEDNRPGARRLSLPGVGQAGRDEFSFGDFLEQLLLTEQSFRQQCSRKLLTRMACLPAIKMLEEYDFGFSPGVPKTLLHESAGLAFVERTENIVRIGPTTFT
jgi:hypothetical protein